MRHPRVRAAAGVIYGRTDVALHAEAARDVDAMAASLRGVAGTVWSSPAARCAALARAITDRPSFDERLLELDFGAWEGAPWAGVPRAALDAWAADPLGFAPPGGESGAALVARVTDFHARLREIGGDCVVVSHGGPLRVLESLLRGEPVDLLRPAPPIGSITWIGRAP